MQLFRRSLPRHYKLEIWATVLNGYLAEYIELGVDGIIANLNVIDRLEAELHLRPERVVFAPRNSLPLAR